MAFEYLEAEMQRMSHDHENLVRQTMELPSLRSTLIDQKYIDAVLKDQLSRSPNIQFISIVQQIEEVSVIQNSTITETSTGAQTDHFCNSTRRNQVQRISKNDDVFMRQQTEGPSSWGPPIEQRFFQSASNHQLTSTTETRIVEEFEEVSVMRTSPAVSGSSGALREKRDSQVIPPDNGQQNPPTKAGSKQSGSATPCSGNRGNLSDDDQPLVRPLAKPPRSSTTWSRNRGNSTAIADPSTHERTLRPKCYERSETLQTDDGRQNEPLPKKPHALSKHPRSSPTCSRNRGNSTATTDSSSHDHTLRPKCNESSEAVQTNGTLIVSSDDEEQRQSLPRPSYSHSKQSGSSTRKKLPRKCSRNGGYLTTGSSTNEHARSRFRTDETQGISADDKRPYQLAEPPLPRRSNPKKSESSRRKKEINTSSVNTGSDRNKKGDGADCTRRVKGINESPKSEKPFECKTCNKTFNDSSNLTKRLRIHSGEKPFECKTCNKEFRRKHHLDEHLRIHSGEKPFECKICKRAFNRSSHMTTHLKKMHPGM